ncbi:MAG: hypothetical protein ACRD8Z_29135, partial [Nitrososphaeraceae archaeon]
MSSKINAINWGKNMSQRIGPSSDVVKLPAKDNRRSLTARIKPDALPIFNQRLKLFGFNSLNELVHAFISGKFPYASEDRQMDNLIENIQTNGLRTMLDMTNCQDFYQNVDLKDMYEYYLKLKKLHPKTCRDTISYFRRFRNQFFTEDAKEISMMTPRIRSKITDAFRKFGQYYLYKYNNDQCLDLVTRIIRRYSLNVGNNDHNKLYIVDDNYLSEKLKLVFGLEGEIG